jgi:hypothetical protein
MRTPLVLAVGKAPEIGTPTRRRGIANPLLIRSFSGAFGPSVHFTSATPDAQSRAIGRSENDRRRPNMPFIAEGVDRETIKELELVLDTFSTNLAVVPVRYAGDSTAAIGFMGMLTRQGDRRTVTRRADLVRAEVFAPILVFLTPEMERKLETPRERILFVY